MTFGAHQHHKIEIPLYTTTYHTCTRRAYYGALSTKILLPFLCWCLAVASSSPFWGERCRVVVEEEGGGGAIVNRTGLSGAGLKERRPCCIAAFLVGLA